MLHYSSSLRDLESRIDVTHIASPVVADNAAVDTSTVVNRPTYELIDSALLARRWSVPRSWVTEHVRPGCAAPIPHIAFGPCHKRFRWGSPELERWLLRYMRPSNVPRTSQKAVVGPFEIIGSAELARRWKVSQS